MFACNQEGQGMRPFQFPLNTIAQLSLYKDTNLIDLAFHKTNWTLTN